MLRVLLDPGAIEYLQLFKRYPKPGGLLGNIIDKGLATAIFHLLQERPFVFWSNAILGILLLGYLLFGTAVLLSKNNLTNISILMALCVGFYFFFLSGGPQGLNRFRLPMMPVLCVFAGSGMSMTIGRFTKSRISPRDDRPV